MTEHTGLSQLADAFHEAAAEKFYPIKKRGGRRYLNPNRHAIAWLEKETADATRIVEIIDVYTGGQWTGTQWTVAHGWYAAKRNGNYTRPMYELFGLECSSSTTRVYTNPCPACLDLSRSWACEEHPEVPWDDEKEQWNRPPADPYATVRAAVADATQEAYQRVLPQPSPGFTVRRADQEAYRHQWEWLPGSPLADPNTGRPGYHYHFATDRWVPDTDDALGDFRGVEVTLPEISAEERMAAEWERQNGIPLADVLAQMNQAFFRNAVLEVNGETVDGILSFSFEAEGDATHDS